MTFLAYHPVALSRHTAGFSEMVSHAIARGFGRGIGRQLANLLPIGLVILIAVVAAFWFFAKKKA